MLRQTSFIWKFMPYILLVSLLVACASPSTNDADIAALKTQVAQLQAENTQLKAGALQPKPAAASPLPTDTLPSATDTPAPTPTSAFTDIVVGQTVTIPDQFEITFKNIYFAKKVVPPNPTGMYSYYEAKDPGTTYLDATIAIKNLQGSGVMSDEIGTIKVIYADKYEYSAQPVIEDRGGADFTYANITSIEPLKLGMLHYLANVPEEVGSNGKPVVVIFKVQDTQYRVKVK